MRVEPSNNKLWAPGLVFFAACSVAQARDEPPAERSSEQPPERSSERAKVRQDTSTRPRCPKEMVAVENSCVDRYEAHLVVEGPGGSVRSLPPNHRPPKGERYLARSEAGVKPQAYISRIEASRACENAGKRLCSVAEWYQACRGPKRTLYPYGDKFEAGRCNVGKGHLLSKYFGTDARAWKYQEPFNSPKLDELPGYLAHTGEYAACVSGYGVHDLVGNLHEWVSDPSNRALAKKMPVQEGIRKRLRDGSGRGVFLGGFFSTTSEHGHGCNFVTAAHEIQYHDYSGGFRCCRDAE